MTATLLALHVLASIVLIGPITVCASLFPRYASAAAAAADAQAPLAVATAMHRVSRTYAVPALAVPVFGIGTAAAMHVLDQPWLIVSMVLTAAAGVVLAVAIVPGQRRLLQQPDAPALVQRLRMLTGLFALTWTVVVVLMIVRPGSTTGV